MSNQQRRTNAPKSEEDYGFVAGTLEWPRAKVAEELGVSLRAVSRMRWLLKKGWSRSRHSWSEHEDDFIRSKAVTLSPAEVSRELPGRTANAVKQRGVALGITWGSRWDRDPHAMGPRTLIAKTCMKCGLLLPASHYNFQRDRYLDSHCKRCKNETSNRYKKSDEGVAKIAAYRSSPRATANAYNLKAQAITAATATRVGQEYTEADHKVLSDPTMTALTKALKLGRTYFAVKNAVASNGYPSLGRPGPTPELEQWIIDNPNASHVEQITASLRAEVEAQGIEWQWDWDDDLEPVKKAA